MTDGFLTLRDYFRFAVSRFNAAGLAYGHGTTNALDEAAFLVLEALHLPVDQLEPFLDARLTAPERSRLAELIEARITTRTPAPYLLGKAYIQGIPFIVDERVLIPRSFIGELLVSDQLVGGEAGLIADAESVESVLDLCTGSGCLAIMAAMVFPNAKVDGVDLSTGALEVAQKNIDLHEMQGRVSLHKGDLFAPLKGRRYDLIITNPPYVDADAMAALPPEYRHEPNMALAAGEDGLDIVHRIIAAAPDHLTKGGGLLCEIGTGRARLEVARPDLDFYWVDTEESSGEVFWLAAPQLKRSRRKS